MNSTHFCVALLHFCAGRRLRTNEARHMNICGRFSQLAVTCILAQVGQISARVVLTPITAGLYTGQGVSVWINIPGVTEEVRDVEQQHKHER